MKNLISLIYVLFFTLFIVSCSNEDAITSSNTSTFYAPTSTSTPTSGLIFGKWNYNTSIVTKNGVVLPEKVFKGNNPKCDPDFIDYKTGGVYVIGDYRSDKRDCILLLNEGLWTQEGNIIYVSNSNSGIRIPYEIVVITTAKLSLEYTYFKDGDLYEEILTFNRENESDSYDVNEPEL